LPNCAGEQRMMMFATDVSMYAESIERASLAVYI
jgi:hypothetical protein